MEIAYSVSGLIARVAMITLIGLIKLYCITRQEVLRLAITQLQVVAST